MIEKMSIEKLYDMFGGTIPTAALTLLQQSDETTIATVRDQLTGMGVLWRSLQGTFLEPPTGFDLERPIFQRGEGHTVVHTVSGTVVGVLPDAKRAEEIVMLLNIGLTTYVRNKNK